MKEEILGATIDCLQDMIDLGYIANISESDDNGLTVRISKEIDILCNSNYEVKDLTHEYLSKVNEMDLIIKSINFLNSYIVDMYKINITYICCEFQYTFCDFLIEGRPFINFDEYETIFRKSFPRANMYTMNIRLSTNENSGLIKKGIYSKSMMDTRPKKDITEEKNILSKIKKFFKFM